MFLNHIRSRKIHSQTYIYESCYFLCTVVHNKVLLMFIAMLEDLCRPLPGLGRQYVLCNITVLHFEDRNYRTWVLVVFQDFFCAINMVI